MRCCLFILIAIFFIQAAIAQTREITGKVTDAKEGTALAGVTVAAKNDRAVSITGPDGSFSLRADARTTAVVFSYTGYKTIEVKTGDGPLNIVLEQGDNQLAEVVVVGYGTKIRRDITGSIAKVGAKELNNTPVTSFESAIQGRAAGVFVSQQNGKLGQGINVRIRGSASVTAGNEPLYVIDGIPLQNTDLSGNGAATNSLSDINTNDIESIEILKDASAAAIYGSRASNGVVLITTKRGKNGNPRLNLVIIQAPRSRQASGSF